MNKKELKQKAAEIIQDEKRKGTVVEVCEILDDISELTMAVGIDRKFIYDSCREYLHQESNNPFNLLLGIVGLRIVRNDTSKWVEPDPENKGGTVGSAYKLDEELYQETIAKIGQKLSAFEVKYSTRDAERVSKINELITSLEKEQQKSEQHKLNMKVMISMIADRIQYMLSVLGQERTDSPVEKQVYEMMEDLEIVPYWTSEGSEYPEEMMFTKLIVDDDESYNMKPCLMREQEIVAKGCKFIKE